eukprot:scaffold37716_cov63-Phaeocystis_antarctica.AAC.4
MFAPKPSTNSKLFAQLRGPTSDGWAWRDEAVPLMGRYGPSNVCVHRSARRCNILCAVLSAMHSL